jgi:hypothetical protein
MRGLNRMTSLGMPISVRIKWTINEGGKITPPNLHAPTPPPVIKDGPRLDAKRVSD